MNSSKEELTYAFDLEANYQNLLENVISQWQKVDSMPQGYVLNIDNKEITKRAQESILKVD